MPHVEPEGEPDVPEKPVPRRAVSQEERWSSRSRRPRQVEESEPEPAPKTRARRKKKDERERRRRGRSRDLPSRAERRRRGRKKRPATVDSQGKSVPSPPRKDGQEIEARPPKDEAEAAEPDDRRYLREPVARRRGRADACERRQRKKKDDEADLRRTLDSARQPIRLLVPAEARSRSRCSTREARKNAELLVKTLATTGVTGKVEGDPPRPRRHHVRGLTRRRHQGARRSRRSPTTSRSRLAKKVRIVAPIPGKNRIGFELPNEQRIPVNLRELVEDRRFQTLDVAAARRARPRHRRRPRLRRSRQHAARDRRRRDRRR